MGGCNDSACHYPPEVPDNTEIAYENCPQEGVWQQDADGSATKSICYLKCQSMWKEDPAKRSKPFVCMLGEDKVARYQGGSLSCIPKPCPSWYCKNNGTVTGDLIDGCTCDCITGYYGNDCSIHGRHQQLLSPAAAINLWLLVALSLLVGLLSGCGYTICITWRTLSFGSFTMGGVTFTKNSRIVRLGESMLPGVSPSQLGPNPVTSDQRVGMEMQSHAGQAAM